VATLACPSVSRTSPTVAPRPRAWLAWAWRSQCAGTAELTPVEAYVFPLFGDVPIADVTTAHVLDALTPIWYEKPETAQRVLQRMKAVFRSAILRGTREGLAVRRRRAGAPDAPP
jgi:hypothetical protein